MAHTWAYEYTFPEEILPSSLKWKTIFSPVPVSVTFEWSVGNTVLKITMAFSELTSDQECRFLEVDCHPK